MTENNSQKSEADSGLTKDAGSLLTANATMQKIEFLLYGLLLLSVIITLVFHTAIIFLAAVLVFILLNYVLHKKFTGSVKDIIKVRKKSERLLWLDQFRGLIVVFLVIASVTWIMSGKRIGGVGDPDYPPIGPTYLNHGWKFAEFAGWPEMITIIDIGQQILMFVMGFVGALAYYRHLENEGETGAFLHLLRRFLALMFIAFLIEGVFDGFDTTEWNLVGVFWTGTFSNLAWGGLVSLLLVRIMKHKPDQRLIIAVVILVIHAILFEIASVRAWEWVIDGQTFFKVPWNTINHIPIAIVGTCTYDWYMLKTDEDQHNGWRSRILPVAVFAFAFNYILDYLQPAEHHDVTSSLALNAIATSMFMLFIFYSFSIIDFEIPALTVMGKNILFMFLLTGLWEPWLDLFSHAELVANPLMGLLVVGVFPMVFSWFIAWMLEKNNIIIKF